MRRNVTFLAAISLIAASCGGGSSEPSTTTTTIVTTTEAPTTTTAPSTTTPTSTVPTFAQELAVVTTNIAGSPADSLDAAIGSVYEAALNPGQAVYATIPQGLLDQFSPRTPQTGPHFIDGIVHYGRILETDIVVAMIGEGDVVLLTGQFEEEQWEIVGAKLTSLGEPAWYGETPIQVLVIGSDARPGQKVSGFRADSIHVVSSLPATGESSIVGIPRDTWVEVEYESGESVDGMDKLTHTMASRGPEVTTTAVETLTGVEIDGYLLTGFLGFEGLIDEFGGFFIDVPYRMLDRKSFSDFQPGYQHLDGTEALAFSRNRVNAPGGDFGRSFNHGSVMKAVLGEMQDRGGVEQVPVLLMLLLEYVETDMDAAQLLTMAVASFEVDPADVPNIVVPGDTTWRSGRSVVVLSDDAYEIFADIADDGRLETDPDEDDG